MILLWAIVAGFLAASLKLLVRGGHLGLPEWRLTWLVPLAFIPQWLALKPPAGMQAPPVSIIAAVLVGSQALLLTFAWTNRHNHGFRMLGLGLGLNLLVIALNGGLMPISPETVVQLAPDAPEGAWQIGARLGSSKDIVLSGDQTRLGLLSDRFLLPDFIPTRVAFSLGDVLIAMGAFWSLWRLAASPPRGANRPQGAAYDYA